MTKQPQRDAAKSKWRLRLLMGLVVVVIACVAYVRTHPLVFNESFFSHAHCIKNAGLALDGYATDNDGDFPSHTNGYGDGLLMLLTPTERAGSWTLTGPGYDPAVFVRALQSGSDVPESECGRVYVQGLTKASNPEIALFFDKLPTPGGDHCHLLARLTAPPGREIWKVGDGLHFVKESEWPSFVQKQIQLLVKEGFTQTQAESCFGETEKKR